MKTKTTAYALTHLLPHNAVRWIALMALNLLQFIPHAVQAQTPPECAAVLYRQGLPPMSIEWVTNNLRLRFTGSPGQRYTIERAPALTGPWTTITTRTAPSSTLLQYDDIDRPPAQVFYRAVHTNSGPMMTPEQFQALPSKPADYKIPYGTDPNQFGELRVPPSDGLHPVVILIHGGCWMANFATLSDLRPMADALKTAGIATWNIEYRRLGQPGAGWPGTYLDVGQAVDHLRDIAAQYRLDLGRVVILGHSAGGHLAMWAAARSRLPSSSILYVADPLQVAGVANLAGAGDLEDAIRVEIDACGSAVVEALLGGKPAAFPERYAQASAIKMLPLGVPQVLIWGRRDDNVPTFAGENYAQAAKQAGDPVLLVIDPDAGHFEIASPLAPTWPMVRSVIDALLEKKLCFPQ